MNITIKKMETQEEIRGKAFVHWLSWHEAYPGIVSEAYLEKFTLEKAVKMAFDWPDNVLVAKDEDRVIGFLGYGSGKSEGAGEIYALYVLSDYYGKGVGLSLMEEGLKYLNDCSVIELWVLKDNGRAIRFYEKCGFIKSSEEIYGKAIEATEIRMIKKSLAQNRIQE